MAARFFARWTRKEAFTAVQWEEPILKHEFEGHREAIWSFVFLNDNIHIMSGSVDGTIRKWNYDTGFVVGEPWKGEGGRNSRAMTLRNSFIHSPQPIGWRKLHLSIDESSTIWLSRSG